MFKFNNIELGEKRISKSFEALQPPWQSHEPFELSSQYLKLKLDELHLAHEFSTQGSKKEKGGKRSAPVKSYASNRRECRKSAQPARKIA